MYDRPLCCRNKFHQQWRTSPHLLSSTGSNPPPPIFKSMSLIIFFLSVLASNSLWLVEFYTPWCGHCTHFAPHYEQVTNQWQSCYQHWLAQVGLSLEGKANVGKVNCERYKQLCSQVLHTSENLDSTFILCFKGRGHWLPYSQNIQQSRRFLGEQFQQQFQQIPQISQAQWDSTCFSGLWVGAEKGG